MKQTDCSIEENELEAGAARIREMRAERTRLAGERQRVAALVQAANGHGSEIESLQRARSEAQALALIDSVEADTGAIDERIVEAERGAAQALAAGETARDALRVIDERRAALEVDLQVAQGEQREAAVLDLLARRTEAIARFNRAIECLRGPSEELIGIERTLNSIRNKAAGTSTASGGLGHNLVRMLQGELGGGLPEVMIAQHTTRRPLWLYWPAIYEATRPFERDYFSRAEIY
jgi:hypothetical protein